MNPRRNRLFIARLYVCVPRNQFVRVPPTDWLTAGGHPMQPPKPTSNNIIMYEWILWGNNCFRSLQAQLSLALSLSRPAPVTCRIITGISTKGRSKLLTLFSGAASLMLVRKIPIVLTKVSPASATVMTVVTASGETWVLNGGRMSSFHHETSSPEGDAG